MENSPIQKTPLFDVHVRSGAKMADFAGWFLPLWYPTGQSVEHLAVRNACGIFDICHMGEIRISGRDAGHFLSGLLTNRVSAMADGQAMYHLMLNENGGVIDDCILYRFGAADFLLVVNASNIQTDVQWLTDHAQDTEIRVKDESPATAKIDLQGPKSPALLAKWIPKRLLEGLRFFHFLPGVSIDGMNVLVSRSGYTGEIGFELYTGSEHAVRLWELLLDAGAPLGILPCGLGSRDTLRVEAGLPLHGHELRPDRIALGHPWEFAIRSEGEFIGKDALLAARGKAGIRRVIPFAMNGKRKAMPGWAVQQNGATVGRVLSAVISPSTANTPIGFLESDRELEQGAALEFKSPETGLVLAGASTGIPFVTLTSRRAMADFLP
jgi:aminomethyltransferase